MTKSVKPIPEGFHTATPTLVVRNAAQAIDYYKKVFGAEEIMRMPSPDGKISHAEIKIGDSIIFLSDEFPQHGGKSPQTLGGFTGGIYLYVKDVDGVFEKAVAAGGTSAMPVWGPIFRGLDPSDTLAKIRVANVVAYIDSMQAR